MRLTVVCLALSVQSAYAFMRFACSQLSIDRVDPLVNPGVMGTNHLHQIVGGNAFNLTMDPKAHDIPNTATCTTCTFSEDFSNYWTQVLFFKAKNGTYKRVPIKPNKFLEQADAGMTIYYIPPYDGKTKVTAFKPGFRMLVGDSLVRDASKEVRQICLRCHSSWANILNEQGPPCAANNDYKQLPPKTCPGGIRASVHFPSCWDGKNLDSPDHKSHVSYPQSGTFESGGPCPASHPVKIPQVMYEIMWDTSQFNNPDDWGKSGTQPFVWSQNDPTGYGAHGDYVFGWKGDALQKAMDANCNGQNCAPLKTQSFAAANACKVKQYMKEDVNSWLMDLPGKP